MEKPREQIGIYLTEEELKAFEEIRWREHKKKTQIGRDAVLEYIKNHSEGNSAYKIDEWVTNPKFQALPSFYAPIEKWGEFYKQCDEKEKTQLRIRFNDIFEMAKNIELNRGRKIKVLRWG